MQSVVWKFRGSESSAFMTDEESRQPQVKTLTHIIQRVKDHWTEGRNGKGFVFIFAANQSGGGGINPIFEFQVQQEDLIRFQRKRVEICGHQTNLEQPALTIM